MRKKTNYVNNKDMLKEIHKSKISFCNYADEKHTVFDAIVENIEDIFLPETLEAARKRRAARIAEEGYIKEHTDNPESTAKLSQFKIDPTTLLIEDMVFRVITWEHIKLEPGRKKNPKSVADHHAKLNFIPFKHYIVDTSAESKTAYALKGTCPVIEVLQSHNKDGEFCLTHGSLTNTLAKMLMLMVNRYGQRSNWRGYTYLDEMKGHALLQLSAMGLQFNEAKSDNPFSYYTASISNAFTRVLNIEKKNQNIRDDLLTNAGINPSFSRQLALEEEIRKIREAATKQD